MPRFKSITGHNRPCKGLKLSTEPQWIRRPARGWLRRENIRRMKPTVGWKVMDTLSVA